MLVHLSTLPIKVFGEELPAFSEELAMYLLGTGSASSSSGTSVCKGCPCKWCSRSMTQGSNLCSSCIRCACVFLVKKLNITTC
jgi:hypothetical protein